MHLIDAYCSLICFEMILKGGDVWYLGIQVLCFELIIPSTCNVRDMVVDIFVCVIT